MPTTSTTTLHQKTHKNISNDKQEMPHHKTIFSRKNVTVYRNRNLGVKENSCVSAYPTDPVSNTRLCYFLSVKIQKEKVKHRPSTKYPYFHKITGPTLFCSGENIEK